MTIRFIDLQARLAAQHASFAADTTQPYTAVIVPSLSFDPVELAKMEGVARYEERSLFNLMLLRHPRLKVVFVTSKRLDPLIIDYYLHHMRGVPSEHARRRLVLLDCDDGSPRPLTEKILERPHLLRRIKAAIDDPFSAHLGVSVSTPLERRLAEVLGIPMNATDPDLQWLGTKSGSREAFREAGLRVPPGRERLRSVDELVEGLVDTLAEAPDTQRIVVKLEEGFSGEGNAILDLRGVQDRSAASLRRLLPELRFEAKGVRWEGYSAQFDKLGGICEAWVEGEGKTSPSVQMRITPAGMVQVVSTHDQVLGGPSGQIFMAATFPARAEYRLELQNQSRRVGEVLQRHGVIGRFGIDFVVAPRPDGHEVYAVEINLRQGGTTHPFNTLKFLTDGRFDEATGTFRTLAGAERCYYATDNCRSERYRGILPFDLIDAMVLEDMQFHSNDTGVVFHLLGCLSEHGKLGATCVAPTIDEAKQLYDRTVDLLERLGAVSIDDV
jgi:hypothetical protein